MIPKHQTIKITYDGKRRIPFYFMACYMPELDTHSVAHVSYKLRIFNNLKNKKQKGVWFNLAYSSQSTKQMNGKKVCFSVFIQFLILIDLQPK